MSPCGHAVDIMRACYTARWYPYPGRPDLYWDVRWYEVPRDTPPLPFPTIWRSSNWDEIEDVLTPGERHDTARWCAPGPPLVEPLGAPGLCGPMSLWRGELPADPADLIPLAIDPWSGVPVCCGPQVPRPRGGAGTGGTVDVQVVPHVHTFVASGGHGTGGVAVAKPIVRLEVAGGHGYGGPIVYIPPGQPVGGHGFGGTVDERLELARGPYFGWMPGVTYLGCAIPATTYVGWVVPGTDGTLPTDHNLPGSTGPIWVPLWVDRDSVIQSAQVSTGNSLPDPDRRMWAAIYRTGPPDCPAPRWLHVDGGLTILDDDSLPEITGFHGAALEANVLYWVGVLFGSADVRIRMIGHAGVAGGPAYPIIDLLDPTRVDPQCGWLGGLTAPPGPVSPWPGEITGGLVPVDWQGIEDGHGVQVGLPAVWLLLQRAGGPLPPIDLDVFGGHGFGGGVQSGHGPMVAVAGGHGFGGAIQSGHGPSYEVSGGHGTGGEGKVPGLTDGVADGGRGYGGDFEVS